MTIRNRFVAASQTPRNARAVPTATALALLWFCVTAAAQEGVIEELLVTASKKGATSLLDTSVTATVVTGDQIDFRGIRNAEDLQFQTPGMVMDMGLATPKLSIRGIGHDNFLMSAENGVAVYTNDIYLGRTQGMLMAFFDLERVDVLKGPQGTAFGRNATGGSVNFLGRRPTPGTEVEIGASGGSFGSQELYGIVNIGSDRYGLRLGAKSYEEDGYVKDQFTGDDLAGIERTIVKAAFSFAPTDNLEGILRVDHGTEDTSRPATPVIAAEPFSIPALLGGTVSYDPGEDHHTVSDYEPFNDVETTVASLHLDWALGGIQLRSVTGYLSVDAPTGQDSDHSEVPFLVFTNRIQSDQFSQEFVLSSSAGAFDWLGGVYYLTDETEQFVTVDFAARILPAGVYVAYDDTQELNSTAVFGQGTYSFNDATRVTLGVRYSEDEKDYAYAQNLTLGPLSPAPGFVVPLCTASFDDDSWDETTWDATLERDLSENTFGYAKVSTGFKAGGFNSTQCGETYEPEQITSFEIGYKGSFRDGSLTLSTSAFYYDYSDIQITQIEVVLSTGISGNVVTNAAEAEVYGIDIELRALLTETLSVDAGFSWVPTSEYESFTSVDALDLREVDGDPATVPEALDLSGNRLNRAPRYSGTLGVNYHRSLSADWQMDARLELYFTDDIAFSPFDRPNPFNAQLFPGLVEDSNIQEGYELINLYVGLDYRDSWSFRLYGKNLTDEYYFGGITEVSTSQHIFGETGRPREAGLQVIYRFAED